MFRKNESGAVDAMLVAVLVIVLAVGGFVLWRLNTAEEVEPVEQNVVSQEPAEEAEDATEEENSLNYIDVEKLDVRFPVDDTAPEIVVVEYEGSEHIVYLASQDFIDLINESYDNPSANCAENNLALYVYGSLDSLRAEDARTEQWSDEELINEYNIKTLEDGRLWYAQNQSQAVCYEEDPQYQFEINEEIRTYLEQLESTR